MRRPSMVATGSQRAILLILLFGCTTVFAQDSPRTVHVFVALADNATQGIVPVAAKLGNGEDPVRNLYWGSAFGIKTFFSRSSDWKLISCKFATKNEVLERCAFKYRSRDVYLIADAYRGREIQTAILDFLDSAAGLGKERIEVQDGTARTILEARGGSRLVAYVGHDGLMDAPLPRIPRQKDNATRQAIILACASRNYFSSALRASGAYPLLWTTNLMAPEAYTLKSALDGWILGESDEQIHQRAAAAYDKYQKCGLRAARNLLVSGW
jgi:hypothetical protein